MKIHNDHRAIEQVIVILNSEIEKLENLRRQLSTQVDALYHSGFQDQKFLELKKVMDDSGQTITEFNNAMNSLKDELTRRKALIVEYYSVAL